jgi:AcrR family transcriptional regulator
VAERAGQSSENAEEAARPRRGRPRDARLDEAILAAVVELLGEIGYAGLTMERVAARAGVSKASLYVRWPGKVGVVADALRHRSGVVPKVPDTGSLRGDMLVFLRAVVRSHRAGFARAASAVSGEIESNPELRDAFRHSVVGTTTDRVRAILGRAVERGELPRTTDTDLLAMLPLAILQQAMRVAERRPAPEAIVERIVDQFFTVPTGGMPPRTRARDDP